MKNNSKENKGITLIALIITIIVLLILAVVTISAVNEGNLFAHANNAATKYSDEAKLENEKISEWIRKMEQYDGGTNSALGEDIPQEEEWAGTYWKNGDSSETEAERYVIANNKLELFMDGISRGIYDYVVEDGNLYAIYEGNRQSLGTIRLLANGTKIIYTGGSFDLATGPIPTNTVKYYLDSKNNSILALENSNFSLYGKEEGDEKYVYIQTVIIDQIIPTPPEKEVTFTYKGSSVTLNSENSEIITGDKFGTYYLFDDTIYAYPGDEDKLSWTLVPDFDTSLLQR